MSKEKLVDWFENKLAEELGKKQNEISLSVSIEDYHLDSISLVSLSQDLEDFVGLYIEPTVFSEFETINEVIQWILDRQNS